MPIEREVTPFIETVAKHYNEASPKEQKQLDLKLQRTRASHLATPLGVFAIFPALSAKTLKVKQ